MPDFSKNPGRSSSFLDRKRSMDIPEYTLHTDFASENQK